MHIRHYGQHSYGQHSYTFYWSTICNNQASDASTLYGHVKTAWATDRYTAIRWMEHWPLIGRLLHLVQRGGAWAGCGPAQSLLAVPNVTAHPSTASVPTSYYSMCHYKCLCTLKCYRFITCPRLLTAATALGASRVGLYVRASVCPSKWSDLCQVKTKMFLLRGDMSAVRRTKDFLVKICNFNPVL